MTVGPAVAETPSPIAPPHLDRRQRAAIGLGNALEFYDFSVLGFFAVPIGRVFFPASDPWTSLLLSVASYGIGYLARPLGALAIGTYADRCGRKPAMLATVVLVAAGTFGIAVLPGFGRLGVAAPLLLVALRLVQGFALGGETGPAVACLIETVSPGRQGRAVIWQVVANGAGLLAAGAIGFALSTALSPPDLEVWGWRCAMLLGLVIVPVGLAIRAGLPDGATAPRAGGGGDGHFGAARIAFVVGATLAVASGTVPFAVGGFMTSYAIVTLHRSADIAFLATIALGAGTVVTAPLGGWLADRVGWRTTIVVSRLALAGFAWPGFAWMSAASDPGPLIVVSFALAVLSTIGTPSTLCLVADAVPSRWRAAGVSIAYALGISIFGSTTQPAATALLSATGDPRSPAWLLVGSGLIGVAAALAIPLRGAAAVGRRCRRGSASKNLPSRP